MGSDAFSEPGQATSALRAASGAPSSRAATSTAHALGVVGMVEMGRSLDVGGSAGWLGGDGGSVKAELCVAESPCRARCHSGLSRRTDCQAREMYHNALSSNPSTGLHIPNPSYQAQWAAGGKREWRTHPPHFAPHPFPLERRPRPSLPLANQHLLGLVHLRGQIGRPARVGVVGNHDAAVCIAHTLGRGRLAQAQDEGGLTARHFGEEATLKSFQCEGHPVCKNGASGGCVWRPRRPPPAARRRPTTHNRLPAL